MSRSRCLGKPKFRLMPSDMLEIPDNEVPYNHKKNVSYSEGQKTWSMMSLLIRKGPSSKSAVKVTVLSLISSEIVVHRSLLLRVSTCPTFVMSSPVMVKLLRNIC